MRILTALVLLCFSFQARAQSPASARAKVLQTCVLPRLSLSRFGNPACTEAVLARARTNGLKFTDLPSIGSGLALGSSNEFFGLTDRGPNGLAGEGKNARRTFPLPEFCPTIVRFKLTDGKIQINEFIPLTDPQGKRISGLSNQKGDGRLFESAERTEPLAFDPNGIDPEALRVLPDGNFLISEEYSPSILVISRRGEVRMRYTPVSKPLHGATYPTKAILPGVFARRRDNKGFENLTLSRDGRFAYAIPQSPMGDETDSRFEKSRVLRVLKLDAADPLNLKVVGEYLARTSSAKVFASKPNQRSVSWSDAECIAPDTLLVIERARGEGKLLLVDLREATNVLERKDESELGFENVETDLAARGIRVAESREIFSTRETPEITSDKLEGLAVLNSTDLAISNDNDFGLGDNETGEPSQVWIVRLAAPLPLK